ncbi:MAG: hypothetical protein LBK99_20310 [Opitutaceae bacterium]|jgi:hypothetical protein|nr:hypothetical protein [Opitutaceae bacterium]
MKLSNANRLPALAAIAAIAVSAMSLHVIAQSPPPSPPVLPIFSDTFAAGTRAGWYASTTNAAAITSAPGSLAITRTGQSSAHLVTYFDPTTLAIGDKLTLNFTYRLSAVATAEQLRFGLFDSGTSGHTGIDGHGTSGTSATPNGLTNGFRDYTGYRGAINMSSGSTAFLAFAERSAILDADNQLLTAAGAYTGTLGETDTTNSIAKAFLGAGQDFDITFTLERTAASALELFLQIAGKNTNDIPFTYSITTTDTTSIVSTFDTFAFSVNGTSGSGPDIILKTIALTKTSAIPEPATTAAAIVGGVFIAIVALARSRYRE